MANEDFISTTNIDINEIWDDILNEISNNVSTYLFDVWIKTLDIVDIKENILVLVTPTKSSKNALNKNCKTKIIEAANKVYNAITDVEFIVKTDIVGSASL